MPGEIVGVKVQLLLASVPFEIQSSLVNVVVSLLHEPTVAADRVYPIGQEVQLVILLPIHVLQEYGHIVQVAPDL